MSECPKCKQKIGLLYLKQNCPHCGVNLRFCNFEENFYMDAKKAELSLSGINRFIAHLKASYIGSKLTVARLCVMLLPVCSFLVPYGKAVFSQPFLNDTVSLSALGLYGAYEDGYLPYLMSMTGGDGQREGVHAARLRGRRIAALRHSCGPDFLYYCSLLPEREKDA